MPDTAFVNLVNTTVFKLALGFSAVFAILAVVAFGAVYIITLDEIGAQTDRELELEINYLESQFNEKGIESLSTLINQREQHGQFFRYYYALTDSDNQRLAGNLKLVDIISQKNSVTQKITFYDDTIWLNDHHEANHLRLAAKKLPNNNVVIIGQASNSLAELREHTFSAVLIALVVTLFLALFMGTYMGHQVMARINRIDQGLATAISSHFKKNLPVPKQADEFQALTLKLNTMLAQIESLISGMRQVTDNIAHDLRSPLTRMRNRLEVTLLKPRDDTEYREVMAQAIEDCNELLKTFNALLSIAQAESGVRRDNWQTINLASLVDELTELYQAVAEDKGLTLRWQKTADVYIDGNPSLIAQAISNLLENAIKYTPENGQIQIQVLHQNDQPIIRVCDTGPGIPAQDRTRVLERFQRLDSARSSKGNGLGLSLVNAVAKLHQASLHLADNHPGLIIDIRF